MIIFYPERLYIIMVTKLLNSAHFNISTKGQGEFSPKPTGARKWIAPYRSFVKRSPERNPANFLNLADKVINSAQTGETDAY